MLKLAALVFVAACAVTPPHAPDGQQPTAPTDLAGWRELRNDEYGFMLRYPGSSTIVQPTDDPDPGVLLRVWVQDATIAKSEVAHVHPPQFAIDVYGNASKQRLSDWLSSRDLNLTRVAQEPVTIGGVEGLRLTGSAQLAPNVFYYVARGGFVYRFTPLGDLAERMLATVTFTR